MEEQAEIGIIGGSGFYGLDQKFKEIKVDTPFGPTSDKLAVGEILGRKIAFLPRHNKNHDLPPHQINYRANVWALKSLGVKEILAVTACGSLQPRFKRGDLVIADQFVDRTCNRQDTFYNGSVVTHVAAAFPYCPRLSKIAYREAKKLQLRVHAKGTVVVVNGPRFSTAAESKWFSKMGWDVVNMTQYPEVILARELEMCYCALALVTDYDAGVMGKKGAKPVSAKKVAEIFSGNIIKVKRLILALIKKWPKRNCVCDKILTEARF